jgi:enolase
MPISTLRRLSRFAIESIHAYEILDSRGNPTLRTRVTLRGGGVGIASVPSGASTGSHEAHELRDGGKRFGGKGVRNAVMHVNTTLAEALQNFDVRNQRLLDNAMRVLDGTDQKTMLGANAILSVSLAAVRAVADQKKMPLYLYLREAFDLEYKDFRMPLATMNVLNGGRHANNGLQVQECMIVPMARSMRKRVQVGAEVFHALKALLEKKGQVTAVGDEGGFAPNLSTTEEALKFLAKAVELAGYKLGKDVQFAMDLAASEFMQKNGYKLDRKQAALSADQMLKTIGTWMKKYPFISIEDPFGEDDWDAWQMITDVYGKDVAIVGDDLFVTNTDRLEDGIELDAANAILIKVNQIGTLSEAIDAILMAQANKYKVSVSHRSGETADTFIADLAVAVRAEFIKTGSLSRSDRVEKYNRLMEIEDELKANK